MRKKSASENLFVGDGKERVPRVHGQNVVYPGHEKRANKYDGAPKYASYLKGANKRTRATNANET